MMTTIVLDGKLVDAWKVGPSDGAVGYRIGGRLGKMVFQNDPRLGGELTAQDTVCEWCSLPLPAGETVCDDVCRAYAAGDGDVAEALLAELLPPLGYNGKRDAPGVCSDPGCPCS